MFCQKHGENLFLAGACTEGRVSHVGFACSVLCMQDFQGIQWELCEGLIAQMSFFPIRSLCVLQYLENKHQRVRNIKLCFDFVLFSYIFFLGKRK